MNELDKWSAEACGVSVDSYGSEGSPIGWKQVGIERAVFRSRQEQKSSGN